MNLFIKNIKLLAGIQPEDRQEPLRALEMRALNSIEDAFLYLENGRIAAFGPMKAAPLSLLQPGLPAEQRVQAGIPVEVIDAKGKTVLPCWCDSHTHTVFAASREEEFVMKIQGKSYEEIAAAGGGILNSARSMQEATEESLFEPALARVQEMIRQGTGALEIKSGYGLSPESELKMLRVIRRLKEAAEIPVKATFLGAHAYPAEYRADHAGYLSLLIDRMLPEISAEGLADYIDVFCEQGFFSVEESDRILEAGAKYGLRPKIHVNQLSVSGGVQLGIKHRALSVDHLEAMGEQEIALLGSAPVLATLLPACSFYLGIPYAPARRLLDAGAAVALATDFNPGSSPCSNMPLVLSIACIRNKMLPEEAIQAATFNGACAMELQSETGSITKGKLANIMITREIPSLSYLPYAFGSNLIETVIINGKPAGNPDGYL